MDGLPAGCRWRRPGAADAEAVFGLVAAHNLAAIGAADYTLDDAVDGLAEPDFDPAADGWLVEAPDGGPLGFGWACGTGDSDIAHVEVVTPDEEVARWLFSQVLARAADIIAGMGYDRPRIDIGVYRADEVQRARVAAHGFLPATTFHRMRIDHDGAPTVPSRPAGVVVRTGPGDEAFRRQAHALLNESFVDHFGFVPRSFEEWHGRIDASATSDWSQLRVASLDAEPVGVLHGNDAFVEDEGCGYVSDVGVRPAARGRGLARLLLRQAFAEDAHRGRRGTLLHVDTGNTTPALDLYRSVGMRVVLVTDLWRRG